MTLLFYLLLL